MDRAQAARALPFPFGRKRKQKGPFCTARRQQKDRDTLKPVRRTFPNSTIHIVSNTWEGSFLPYGQKSPHEPRSQILWTLSRPSDSAQRHHKDADYESDQIDKTDVSQKGKICGTSCFQESDSIFQQPPSPAHDAHAARRAPVEFDPFSSRYNH